MKRYPLILCAVLCVAAASAVTAGPVLDRLLNQMVLDANNGVKYLPSYKMVAPEAPIGQTFTTGPDIVEVCRIAIGCAYWNEEWSNDESLVMTLWDSPAKTKAIGSEEIPWKWRGWTGAVPMFTLDAPVEPSKQYYFELTVKGGNGKINAIYHGSDYQGGTAYEGGRQVAQSIWFEIHGRRKLDRDKVYSDALSRWNIDFAGLEKTKAAYETKDWDRAVDELIAFYESRLESYGAPIQTPVKSPTYDRSYADMVMEQKVRDTEGNIADIGPRWNHYRNTPTIGAMSLDRHGIMGVFKEAYLNTGDEVFPTRFNDMMINVINDQPSPLRAGAIPPDAKDIHPATLSGIGGGSMWTGLSTGARINQMWAWYSGLAKSPSFTRDVRAAMIFNMVNMAEVLAIQKGGGNWETQMTSSLWQFADRQPELKASPAWFEKSLAGLLDNMWVVSRADGTMQEPTSNYHNLMLNRFSGALEKCRAKGVAVDPKYIRRVEKIMEYTMFSVQPDGNSPSTGDTFNFNSPAYLMLRGADYFGRDDFLYVGTGGKEGKAPAATSARFPIMGWYVMRSDWTPDARYLCLHNGPNMSHGHPDELEVVVSAYGKSLIADPGCYIYGTPKHNELARTKRHPTVTVDGADTIAGKGDSTWANMRTLDYYAGTNTGYRELPTAIRHTRRIIFAKPDYWVISDTANGEGEHAVVSNLPFGLGVKGEIDAATGACHTTNDSGNILILPEPGNSFKGEVYDTDYPIWNKRLEPAQGVRYTQTASLPVAMTMALYPYEGAAVPNVVMEKIGNEAYRVKSPSGTDFVCFGDCQSGELSFVGEALLARPSGERLKSVAWVNGRSIAMDGRVIASAATNVVNLEVVYDGDTVAVSASSSEPSLKVATCGAKWMRVGPGPLRAVSGEYVEPFAAAVAAAGTQVR